MTERDQDDKLTARQVLGSMLRHLRERAGLSLRDLAAETTYSYSYLGRAETGDQLPSDALVKALDTRFEMGGTLVEMLDLAREGSVQEYGRKAAAREMKAERIQVCSSSRVPGLLQTEDYARAMFRTTRPKAPPEYFSAAVADRMQRQRVFTREEPPPYWAIMDEAVLARAVGGSEVMAAQLAHIVKTAENPDLTIQVIPYSHGAYQMLGGSLTLLTAPSGSTIAYVEGFATGELVESPKRVVELTQHFDMARGIALPECESLALIQDYAEGYR
ncbi:helix-turn-helix domain-containing protein [Streptomyces gobiensis]|uniref:helix-turn-helix domain-containing protein n=1 Tax=Streptomyces gobiensis TaxID=2875706 RepID=UPI001E61E4F0|nr:helix-turn-helix transcriptional regulator [Streptomyces gobiensis]UGY93405.1 helix-turn-helix domain-containing protein [Streptomyces gobiensis]